MPAEATFISALWKFQFRAGGKPCVADCEGKDSATKV